MRQMQLALVANANVNHAEDHRDEHLVTMWGMDGLPQTVYEMATDTIIEKFKTF